MRSLLLLGFVSVPLSAESAVIRVQPIQVCNNQGTECAQVDTFEKETNKIYAQNGDSVEFLPVKVLKSSRFLDLKTTTLADGLIASETGTERTEGAYDMWFVRSITGGMRAGRAAYAADGVVISDDIIALRRIDTIAHELGHNLGFSHVDRYFDDASPYLMASGGVRRVPDNLENIAPDGAQLSRFSGAVPTISLDMIGSIPGDTASFFNVSYLDGIATDVELRRISLDLGPARAFVAPTDEALSLSNLNGISAEDISDFGAFDGSPLVSLDLAPGSFSPLDSFSFGFDIGLLDSAGAFGATPEQLRDATVRFDFNNGFTVTNPLSDLRVVSIFDPTANYDRPISRFSEPDPMWPQPAAIPVPPSGFLVLGTLAASGFARYVHRRRSARVANDNSQHATGYFRPGLGAPIRLRHR